MLPGVRRTENGEHNMMIIGLYAWVSNKIFGADNKLRYCIFWAKETAIYLIGTRIILILLCNQALSFL